jgi:hypothetical protein
MRLSLILFLPGCIADVMPRAPSPDTIYSPPEIVVTFSMEPTPRQRWVDYFVGQGMGYDEASAEAGKMMRIK